MSLVARASFQTLAKSGALLLGRSTACFAPGQTLPNLFQNADAQVAAIMAARQKYTEEVVPLKLLTPMMNLADPLQYFSGKIRFFEKEAPAIESSDVYGMSDLINAPTKEKIAGLLKLPNQEIDLKKPGTIPVSIQVVRQLVELTEKTPDSDGTAPFIAGVEVGPFSALARLFKEDNGYLFPYSGITDEAESLLQKITLNLIRRAQAHMRAGAQGVIICEPAAGMIGPSFIHDWSNVYVRQILDAIADEGGIPIYHNCGDQLVLPDFTEALLHPENGIFSSKTSPVRRMIHIGNGKGQRGIDIRSVANTITGRAWIGGNFDPVLFSPFHQEENISDLTLDMLGKMEGIEWYVPSPGCDQPFDTIVDRTLAFLRETYTWNYPWFG